MRTIILRFRYTLYFILFSIIPLTITGMSRDEDFSGGAATIFLLVCLPGIFISFFKAGVMAFKDLMNYAHGYAWPKDEHIFEDDVVNYFKNYTLDEIYMLKNAPIKDKVLYIFARLSSIVFFALSIYLMANLFNGLVLLVSIILFIGAIVIFIMARVIMFKNHKELKRPKSKGKV